MTFNLGSLCIAILWNSIFIGIVFWMGKKKIYTTRKGIQLTLMFYLLGVVRMIFPIDFRPSIGIQVSKGIFATVYKGNIIKNLIMDCQSYTKYRPNETTGGIFVSWRRKEELPTGA